MKHINFFILFLLLSLLSIAQVPAWTYGEWVENSEFECWEDQGTPEMEPCNWSSIKTANPPLLASQAPDGSVSRATGRNGGYCMLLTAQEFTVGPTTIVANGIATTGRVFADYDPDKGFTFTDSSNEKWYMPQVHAPDSIMGYYKFAPSGSDKGKVEALIHSDQDLDGSANNGIAQIPDQTQGNSNHIARARIIFSNPQPQWTRFSTAFDYFNSDMPHYMLITCNAGDSTSAVDGTQMWIDDLEVVYNTLSLEENEGEFIDFTIRAGEQLFIDKQKVNELNLAVYNSFGKLVFEKQNIGTNTVNLPRELSDGVYIFKLYSDQSQHTKKYFIK